MSNLEEDDTSLATSKAASSTSDSSSSEEEMETDAGLLVRSLQEPDTALQLEVGPSEPNRPGLERVCQWAHSA